MCYQLRTLSCALLMVTAALILASCGSTDNPTDPTGTNGGTGGPDPRGRTRIYEAYNAPQFVDESAESSITLCTEAVFVASTETGGSQLVTTGTLKQTAPNSNQFSYTPTPADRLRLAYSDGSVTEFVISSFNGDLSRDAERFLERNHQLAFTMKHDGVADVQIVSQQNNGQREKTMQGSLTFEGIAYSVDINVQSSEFSDVVGTTFERQSESTITGTIFAPELSITVDEYNFYHRFASNNLVEERQRKIRTSWQTGSDRYAFVNGRLDNESVSGTITRNGEVVGELSGTFDRNGMNVRANLLDELIELGTF